MAWLLMQETNIDHRRLFQSHHHRMWLTKISLIPPRHNYFLVNSPTARSNSTGWNRSQSPNNGSYLTPVTASRVWERHQVRVSWWRSTQVQNIMSVGLRLLSSRSSSESSSNRRVRSSSHFSVKAGQHHRHPQRLAEDSAQHHRDDQLPVVTSSKAPNNVTYNVIDLSYNFVSIMVEEADGWDELVETGVKPVDRVAFCTVDTICYLLTSRNASWLVWL